MQNDSSKILRRVVLVLVIIAFVMSATLAALLVRKAIRSRRESEEPAAASETAAAPETATPAPEPSDETSAAPETSAPAADAGRQSEAVQKVLDDFVAAQDGAWDVYYESLSDGASAAAQSGHGSEPRSVAASLIKLYVMGAVYDAVAHGKLTHDAVYNDLYSMITVSDNDACNRLVTLLGGGNAAAGMKAVNAFAAAIGCTSTQMNRLMLQPGTENFVTARECGTILRAIYNGSCVSADASKEMLTLLKAQTVNDRLPVNLPQGVTVAHKTGNLSNLSCGDVGIILSPKGDYILCVIANHEPSDATATTATATLSRTVYDTVTG